MKGSGKLGGYSPTHSKSSIGGSTHKAKESGGVSSGVSSLSEFDSNNVGPSIDYDANSVTGNATERIKANPKVNSANKNGKSFTIC